VAVLILSNPPFKKGTGNLKLPLPQPEQGIEFDVSGEILPDWNIIASTSYIDARITKDNVLKVANFLDNIPP
jgi:iron complex outermembrane receptor protein